MASSYMLCTVVYATVVENNVTRFSTDNENNIYLNIKLAKVQFIFNRLLKTQCFRFECMIFFLYVGSIIFLK